MKAGIAFTTSIRTPEGRVLVNITFDALETLNVHKEADELTIFAANCDYIVDVARALLCGQDGFEVTVDAGALQRYRARSN